jgi:hypothetical protein
MSPKLAPVTLEPVTAQLFGFGLHTAPIAFAAAPMPSQKHLW